MAKEEETHVDNNNAIDYRPEIGNSKGGSSVHESNSQDDIREQDEVHRHNLSVCLYEAYLLASIVSKGQEGTESCPIGFPRAIITRIKAILESGVKELNEMKDSDKLETNSIDLATMQYMKTVKEEMNLCIERKKDIISAQENNIIVELQQELNVLRAGNGDLLSQGGEEMMNEVRETIDCLSDLLESAKVRNDELQGELEGKNSRIEELERQLILLANSTSREGNKTVTRRRQSPQQDGYSSIITQHRATTATGIDSIKKCISAALENRIELGDEVLVLGRCDLFFQLHQNLCDILHGKGTFAGLERGIAKLAIILDGHMKVVASARSTAMSEVRRSFILLESLGKSISELLEETDEQCNGAIGEGKLDNLATAAKKAAEEYDKSKEWTDFAKLDRVVKTVVNWLGHLVAILRIYQHVSVREFHARAGRTSSKQLLALILFFEPKAGNGLENLHMNMAKFCEKHIITALSNDDNKKSKAIEMIAIIRKQFAAKKYENEYKMAGLMTLTKPFDQYSGEEIKRLLCSDNETYFQINKKATLRAARIIPSTLYAIGAEKNLVEHTTLSKEDAAIFPFALTFSTPTEYVGSSLDFLFVICQGEDGLEEEDVDVETKVKSIFENMVKVLKKYAKTHIYIDIDAEATFTSYLEQSL